MHKREGILWFLQQKLIVSSFFCGTTDIFLCTEKGDIKPALKTGQPFLSSLPAFIVIIINLTLKQSVLFVCLFVCLFLVFF